MVAWERELVSSSQDNDILRMPLKWVTATDSLAPQPTTQSLVQTFDNELDATVCAVGGACLIGYATNAAGDFDSKVASRDLLACRPCEGDFDVSAVAGREEYAPQMASTYDQFGWPGEEALLAVERRSASGFTGGIWLYLWQNQDGAQEQLDTCLGAGRIAAPCAIVGNPEFRVFQFDGPTSSPTFLVLSPGVLPVPSCSQCPIIADPFQGWVLTDSTNVDGAADVLVPIPAANELIGAELFAQWLTPKPGGCPLFGVPLGQTSPLRLRIE
jgi:hypothetical protein